MKFVAIGEFFLKLLSKFGMVKDEKISWPRFAIFMILLMTFYLMNQSGVDSEKLNQLIQAAGAALNIFGG